MRNTRSIYIANMLVVASCCVCLLSSCGGGGITGTGTGVTGDDEVTLTQGSPDDPADITGAGITGTPTIDVDYCCSTPTDPATGLNYFPEISIIIPPVFSQTSSNQLIPTDDVQQAVSAEIFEEVVCQVNVIVTDLESAELAYNSLLTIDTLNVISIDSINAGDREGQEVLYNQDLENGTNVTGLGRIFYFNAAVDQLALSSIIVADCFGETSLFNQRKALIDDLVQNLEFDVDATASGFSTR